MINQRIFGSTIDEKVQLELRKRQGETKFKVFETRDGKTDYYENSIQPYSPTFVNERICVPSFAPKFGAPPVLRHVNCSIQQVASVSLFKRVSENGKSL